MLHEPDAPPGDLSDAAQAVWRQLPVWTPLDLPFTAQKCWPLGAAEFLAALVELVEANEAVTLRPIDPGLAPYDNFRDNRVKRVWRVPEWMEPFRPHVTDTGGNTLEWLLNDIHTTVHDNCVLSGMIIAVADQVRLLYLLHNRGVLIDPPPCPNCQSRATSIVFRREGTHQPTVPLPERVWECFHRWDPPPKHPPAAVCGYRWIEDNPDQKVSDTSLDFYHRLQLENE